MSEAPKEENPFEQIPSSRVLDVLQNAVATRSKCHIWTEGRKHQHVGRIAKVGSSESVILLAVPKEKKFQYALDAYGIDEVFFSVQLPGDLIYFKARVRQSDDLMFSFKLVEPLYKVQRRQAIRVPVPGDMCKTVELKVEGRSAPVMCDILNISSGGVGLLTKELTLEKEFSIGKAGSVSFQFGTLPVSATGNLRYLQIVQGTLIAKRLKIGFQFDEIHSKTVDEIHTYVMSESTKYLGRKM